MSWKKVSIIVGIVLVLAAVVAANLYFRRETGLNVNAEASGRATWRPSSRHPARFSRSARSTSLRTPPGESRVSRSKKDSASRPVSFLLEIDPRSLDAQLQRGEASVAAAQSSLQQARAACSRRAWRSISHGRI